MSSLAGEVAILPPKPTLWSLSEDDDGECFLDNGDDVRWASESLQQPLFWGATAARLCIIRQGKQIMLEDLVAERFAAFETVYATDGVGDVRLEVCGWHCARSGSKLWWRILRLHKALQLKSHKGDSGRWAEHGWARWERAVVEDFGLPACQPARCCGSWSARRRNQAGKACGSGTRCTRTASLGGVGHEGLLVGRTPSDTVANVLASWMRVLRQRASGAGRVHRRSFHPLPKLLTSGGSLPSLSHIPCLIWPLRIVGLHWFKHAWGAARAIATW